MQPDVGGWTRIKSIVDSGAGATVAPPEIAPNVQKRESEGSKRGQVFVSASQDDMPNIGEKPVVGKSEEWEDIGTIYQIIDGVDRPLDSVSSICDKGNWVAFGKNGGFIQSLTTGKTTFFNREDDVYVRSMWIKDEDGQGFTRPEM